MQGHRLGQWVPQVPGLIQMGDPLSQTEEGCLKEERKEESQLKVIFI